jgi:hypothetical protein
MRLIVFRQLIKRWTSRLDYLPQAVIYRPHDC